MSIVPDDFDLNDALNQRSTTDESERIHCPECDSTKLRTRGTGVKGRQADYDYLCGLCGAQVDESDVVRGE